MDGIRYSVSDGVARLTLDRPDRLNAFDEAMARAVLRRLEDTAADPAVRVLVLTGAGRAFCAGGDVRALGQGSGGGPGDDGTRRARELLRIAELLQTLPAVTVAAVNGPCAGGGLAWACACDLRIASRSAVFVPAFADVGQTGDYGISWTLPRLVGAGRARDLLLVGDRIDAAEAERIGLVTRVLDDAALGAAVDALAAALAAKAPLALRAIRANLDGAATASLAAALDAEATRMMVNNATEDAAEAARAFLERRPPVFHGR